MLPQFDGVLFDLLTALLDSWTLWNRIAGGEAAGRRWRLEYLRIVNRTGAYRAYEDIVGEAAQAVGLPPNLAAELAERYGELKPWPGVPEQLKLLVDKGIAFGVVTNCSERLGNLAAKCVGAPFSAIVTAERAGFYKPDPHPFALGLQELGVLPSRCLFVAGSAYDLAGAAKAGMKTYWHDRLGMDRPPEAPKPLIHAPTLDQLKALLPIA
ncbi:MAG TPA: HAD-IA family hydrolase [Rhodospirillaceae bacterium]|nr:HAD-IA family hydrolase [Rhodospirillaceae bacterium]